MAINEGFLHANLNLPSQLPISSTFSHAPSMSAIDRFLLGRLPSKNPVHFTHKPDPKQIRISPPSGQSLDGFSDFSSSSSTSSVINIADGNNVVDIIDAWSSMHDSNISDGGSIGSYSNNRGSKIMRKGPLVIQGKRICKGNTSRRKPSRVYIKGQWSEEEDSKLADLVNEHGDRSWALISTKLFGRAGKQCRERWCNHLRPNIKKDSWSEEEERIVVQTHIQVGNKWAEIARHISGRTENSIKNHWNATIRKQFFNRKTKKDDKNNALHNTPPSLLERYIIFRHFGAGYNILDHLDDVAPDFEADVAPVGPTVHFGGPQMQHEIAMPNYFEPNNNTMVVDPHSDQYGNIDLAHLWDPQTQYGNIGFDFSPMAMFDTLNLDEMMFINTHFPNNNLNPTPVNHHGFPAVDSTQLKVSFSPANPSIKTLNNENESNFVTSILN